MLDPSDASLGTGPPGDRATVAAAIEVLSGTGKRRGLARLAPFLGPAIIASVAYVDPGNFATNLQSGSQLGYTLLWVVVTSNLMAMVIQTLSAKLGVATGHNLAEQCRLNLPRGLCLLLWGVMEIVAMATDLAEFLGAALGFHLLFGLPLGIAGLLTAVVTFLLLSLERYGFRRLELVIALLVAAIAVSYLAEIFLARPDWKQAAFHAVVPAFGGRKGVLLASGILGATVMPHVIFLHSALTQGRIVVSGLEEKKRLLRYQTLDVVLALGLAGAINGAMLIMAACAFHAHGLVNVDAIEEAHLTLQPLLGSAAGTLFAIALLASGLSSSAVGTMAGQVVMQGFLEFRIPLWVRRVVTMAPALLVIGLGVNPTQTLVLSQVVLSLALPFAVVPLVVFSSRKRLMGPLVNRPATTAVAAGIATLIVAVNVYLLWEAFFGS
ncbi:MAG TPA: Nramp family divalent metal transporter [Polyangia bacterium]|nr:Nramp family divalent metal transporter [Polyangia bacterium]